MFWVFTQVVGEYDAVSVGCYMLRRLSYTIEDKQYGRSLNIKVLGDCNIQIPRPRLKDNGVAKNTLHFA